MNQHEFAAAIAADPNLAGPIERAAQSARPGQFTMLDESAVVALMYPVVRHVMLEIDLPWLYELGRYCDLWREKFHNWVDEQAAKKGSTPMPPRPRATPSAPSWRRPPTSRPARPGSAWQLS